MLSDESLLLEFQSGSHAALEELFDRYQRALHAFFARRLTDRHRADDLVQDTFIALMRAHTRYEPRSSFRSYLYGIAFHILLAERRRVRNREGSLPVDPNLPGSMIHPDRALWVQSALLKLEEGDREILMLREYEQLSYAEIATLLRVPLNTVRTRLFRSRLGLKRLLEPSVAELAGEGGL